MFDRITLAQDLLDCRGAVLGRKGLVVSAEAIDEAAAAARPGPVRPLSRTAVAEDLHQPLAEPALLPADIDDAAPLFGDGLGLDSIDALELVIGIEKVFGVRIQDEEVGAQAFASVNAIAEFLRSKGVADAA